MHVIDGFLATDRYLLVREMRREVKMTYCFCTKTSFGKGICLV